MRKILSLLLLSLCFQAVAQKDTPKVSVDKGKLKATAHSVSLSWNPVAPVAPITSITYNVYRAATSGGYTLGTPFKTGLTGPSYVDLAVTALQKYFYVVTAVGTCPTCNPTTAESGFSNEVSATIPPDTITPPAAPTGLTVTTVAMNNGRKKDVLVWKRSVTPNVVYRVYRSINSNPFLRIAGGFTRTSYTDAPAPHGLDAYYTTAFLKASGLESSPSNIVSVRIP